MNEEEKAYCMPPPFQLWNADGGPAFPINLVAEGTSFKGMTLRDWLTGQALAGLCANPETWASEGIGRWAVDAADAAMDKLGGKGGAE